MRNFKVALAIAFGFIAFTSCQKELDHVANPIVADTTTNNTTTSDNDSALAIAKDIYLWYNQIPADFKTTSYADPAAEMQAIRTFSIEPGFTDPVDRYSFAIKQAEWDNVSSGIEQDFGMSVFFNSANDLRVKYAESAAPSGLSGVQRGWQITSINGNTTIDTSEATINRIVDAVFNSSSTSFTFKKPDGSSVDITLNATAYQTHPIFSDSVYTINNNKVGYLSFNSFLGDTTEIANGFSRVFSKFAQNNISDVVVDLRYNGGGYVSVAEQLVNYLAPASANGQTMYTETFNDKYTDLNETATFHKLGGVNNLSRIFFIVSDNTASASELVINCLKPFVTEVLIGPAKNTYGKPVGFFPIPVGDWYTFPVSFKTVNKDGNGNYFNGFTINYPVRDGVDKNWGDANENCLKSALNYIQSGSATGRTNVDASNAQLPSVNIAGNAKLNAKTFKGAVDKRTFNKH